MARTNNNPILQKVTGTLGKAVTFKTYNGETYITKKATHTKPWTPAQRRWRAQFSMASRLANEALLDPEKRKEYESIAKSRKLSSAYTAANQDMLKAIRQHPWEETEEIVLACTQAAPVKLPATSDDFNASVKNESDALAMQFFGGDQVSSVGDPKEVSRQLTTVTQRVQHCLHELQKAMTSVHELLQKIQGSI